MKLEFEYKCDKEWDDMKGGSRRRHCDSCDKHVHHISHMTKDEALKFLRDRQYEVCVDFFCDADGHAIFREKERKLGMQTEGLKQLVASAVAVIPLALAAAFIDFDRATVVEPITATSAPSPGPLDLGGPTPVVINTTPNVAFTDFEPPAPVIEEVVEPPAPATFEEPAVVQPIRHLRGKIAMPRDWVQD